MMFLEVQWSGPCQDIPSKVKEKFYISHLTTRKGTHCLVNLFGVYRQHISQCSGNSVLILLSILIIHGQVQSRPAKGTMTRYFIR